MGGWSGGVYTRFRNWISDKANSINPQAALFDQEDDGFAAGLNNCVTKDGLNKPSSAMDWNGQNLTGVLNFANTGTVSLVGGKLTLNLTGNLVSAPTAGVALTLGAVNSQYGLIVNANAKAGIQIVGSAAASASIDLVDGGAGNQLWSISSGFPNTGSFGIVTTAGAVAINITSGKQLQHVDTGGTLHNTGFLELPQNAQSANYTTVLADNGKHIIMFSPATGVNIPANSSVAYPTGTVLTFVNANIGSLAIGIVTDTLTLAGTATTGARTLATNGIATALKTSTTSWLISGAGLT